MATIMMVGAFDTKGVEYAFLREQILARGHEVLGGKHGRYGRVRSLCRGRGCQRGGGGWLARRWSRCARPAIAVPP